MMVPFRVSVLLMSDDMIVVLGDGGKYLGAYEGD